MEAESRAALLMPISSTHMATCRQTQKHTEIHRDTDTHRHTDTQTHMYDNLTIYQGHVMLF